MWIDLGIASVLAIAAGIVFAVGLRARRRGPEPGQSAAKLAIGLTLAVLSLAIHGLTIAGLASIRSRTDRRRAGR